MPGRRFWILAASLGLACAAVAADPAAPAAKPARILPNIDGDSFYSEDGGKVFVAVKGMVEVNGATLSADLVKIDQRTGVITAEGRFVYATNNLRILGEKATLNPKTDTIVAHKVRFGRSPTYFTAEEFRMVKGDKTMTGVRMWRNEPEPDGMHLDIAEVRYTEKDDWLAMRRVRPSLAGVPFFLLPYYGQEGYRDIPYELWLGMGSSDAKGFYFRGTGLMRQTPALWVGGLLDYYDRSGLLIGPALRYDNRKAPGAGTVWQARLQGAVIHDGGELLVDSFGRVPDRHRSFAHGELIGRTPDGIEIAGRLFAESDPDFIRDFRPNLLGRLTTPEASLEVVAPAEGAFLSASVTAKADDYQDVVQRLPEVRFDLPSSALGGAGFRQRSFVSLAYLSERPSAALNGAAYLATTGTAAGWSTGRLDTYYGVTYPWALSDWATFTPVAGVRATGWSSALDGTAATKAIGQVGFDLEGLATGSWNLVANKWSIDGMRHSFRPVLQVRALPGADRGYGTLPMSDRIGTSSVLEEFDLADRPDAASTTATESVRFGLRNTLATRDTRNGTRDLLRADFFTDWRHGSPSAQVNGRSDFIAHVSLTPAPWVTIDSLMILPNGGGGPKESIQSIAFNSGDFWNAGLSWAELDQGTPARQLGLRGEVVLNSIFTGFGAANYDALNDQTNLLAVGLIQKMGKSWELEYSLQKRVSDRGDSSLGFHLRARLFKF
jgi:LPS-assembly protein